MCRSTVPPTIGSRYCAWRSCTGGRFCAVTMEAGPPAVIRAIAAAANTMDRCVFTAVSLHRAPLPADAERELRNPHEPRLLCDGAKRRAADPGIGARGKLRGV